MKAIELLKNFVADQEEHNTFPHNSWLNGEDMAVYVRKSVPRILNDGNRHVTLDIASINVYKKGQGQFTKFLAEAEKLNPWPAIYVENVQETRFGNFLLRQGYTQQNDTYPVSFYKMKG